MPPRDKNSPQSTIKMRVNRDIREREIRVIGPEGEQMGIMSPSDAINKSSEYGLDLVEVAPTAKPPVCRIMDFGKFNFVRFPLFLIIWWLWKI